MKVSIIMSVYNGEKYLKESIDSILEQTYRNFEFLIVNDCSTDNSEDIIFEYMKKDKRIRYFSNDQNLGLTRSLNNMIALSEGELIARMDSDDIALKDRLAKQVDIFKQYENVDVVFTNAILIDDKSEKLCDSWRPSRINEIIKRMPVFNYIMHPSTMIKKQIFNKVGLYNEEYITGQDKELWLRIIQSNGKFYYLNEQLLKYRINPNSVRVNQRTNYFYKLSKVCIANKQKRKAIEFIKTINNKEKVDIIARCLIPFFLYKRVLYVKNSIN